MLDHNPGISWLAEGLLTTPPKHPRFPAYPTCATLIVDFPIDTWTDLKRHSGTVQGKRMKVKTQ